MMISYLQKLEKYLLNWIIAERYHVIGVILVAAILWSGVGIPYINLVLNQGSIQFLILLSIVVIFKVRSNFIVLFSFTLLGIAMLSTLIGNLEVAETFGDYTYGLLAFVVIKSLIDKKNEIFRADD